MNSAMTTMTRLPERWQLADALSSEETSLGGARRQTGAVGSVIRSASGLTGRLAVRTTTGSVADEPPAVQVAHGTSVVELQTSKRGVNAFTH